MACYLCAYAIQHKPAKLEPAPAGTPRSVGICSMCSVAACSKHGARYTTFKCALCKAAQVATAALRGGGDVEKELDELRLAFPELVEAAEALIPEGIDRIHAVLNQTGESSDQDDALSTAERIAQGTAVRGGPPTADIERSVLEGLRELGPATGRSSMEDRTALAALARGVGRVALGVDEPDEPDPLPLPPILRALGPSAEPTVNLWDSE